MKVQHLFMARNDFSQLDFRKWFDQMQPQTVSIATWLLYIDGVFNLLDFFDERDVFGYWRVVGGPIAILAFLLVLCFPTGGFLMANGKKLGWFVALAASFSPFLLRALEVTDDSFPGISFQYMVFGSSYIKFMFETALCALLLHTMTRNYVKAWLR
jgi:hypothetical protein